MSIYVNGTLATGPTTVTVPVADGGQPVRIGSRNDGVTMMNGSIDDVRIYNRALSAAEVLQLYKSTASVVNTTVNVPNINTGLVGHWSFDGKDMLQNAKDSSGSGNNGNLQAFISTSSAMAAGKVGQAINFNVVNPHVDVPSSASFTTSAFTLSLWIKPTTTANWQGLIFKGTSSPYHFALAMNDLGSGHYRSAFFTDANGWSYDTTNTNNYGAWTHVVFTYDGTTGKFYANGSPGPSATLTVGSNTNTMSFGLWGSFPFKGLMDDVRIYNRALSAAEVLQLYKSTSATLK